MKLVLKDGTEIGAISFTYGINRNDLPNEPDIQQQTDRIQIANVDIVIDKTKDIQTQIKELCKVLTTDNISTIKVTTNKNESIYKFNRCVCCQHIISDNQNYIYIQLTD